MKATLNHLQYNIVAPEKTLAFYKDLLNYFEMQTLYEGDGMLGIGDGHHLDLVLAAAGRQETDRARRRRPQSPRHSRR